MRGRDALNLGGTVAPVGGRSGDPLSREMHGRGEMGMPKAIAIQNEPQSADLPTKVVASANAKARRVDCVKGVTLVGLGVTIL